MNEGKHGFDLILLDILISLELSSHPGFKCMKTSILEDKFMRERAVHILAESTSLTD
jgi:hypothetical protein